MDYNLYSIHIRLVKIKIRCIIGFIDFLDMCYQRLGLEDGKLPDSSLSASSSYDEASVGPQNAR